MVRQRTMLINAVRSHCAEFGLIAPQGALRLADLVVQIRSADEARLPPIVASAMLLMVAQIEALMTQINQLGRVLLVWHREDEASQRLASIPGVGVITATALVATVTDPTHFRSGREFAAFLGLVPRQNSSGGKERIGRISKMGDRYLRKLLVMGATSVIRRARTSTQGAAAWIRSLLERRPARVVTVAMANKTARIAWALLARGDIYRAASHA